MCWVPLLSGIFAVVEYNAITIIRKDVTMGVNALQELSRAVLNGAPDEPALEFEKQWYP